MAFIERMITAEDIATKLKLPKETIINLMKNNYIKHIYNKKEDIYYTYNYYLDEFLNMNNLGKMLS